MVQVITVHCICSLLLQTGNKSYTLLWKCYSINFTSFFNTSFKGLNWSGRILIFIVPSAPQEKMWFAGPVSICMTPVPIFLKIDCRACSLIKVWRRLKDERLQIFILPSADPVTKYSSVGSIAMALTGESWLWKSCLCCRCRRSNIHVKPFLPPDMRSWCLGAYAKTVAPLSWQVKAWTKLLAGATSVSHRHMFLLSLERPAVAIREEGVTQ